MKIDIDVIGTLYSPGEYDSEGEVITAPVELPGYHVNTTFPVVEWDAYKVTPATPRRVFGGHPTHFYSFADQAEYEAELETADLNPAIVEVPRTITMRQARLALAGAGLLDTVNAAVAAASSQVQIEWQYASDLQRDWPTLLLLAGALGLTDAQVDELFIAGSKL